MASEAASNEADSSNSIDMTPAQRLQQKHKADASHRATIEDVADEEDIMHPPPSMDTLSDDMSSSTPSPPEKAVSEKAAGKQKAREELNGSPTSTKPKSNGTLDTQSEELFPALGGGPRLEVQTPVPKAWGAKSSSSTRKLSSHGVNGSISEGSKSTDDSSRASTPAFGSWAPNVVNATSASQSRGFSNPRLAMPGKSTERISFVPSQLLPRNQLKKPIQEVLRSINKRSKAHVEMKPGPGGALDFEGVGPADAVKEALMETANAIGSKVGSLGSTSLHC